MENSPTSSWAGIQKWLNALNSFRVFLVLAALGLMAYANAVNHPFVHDDVVFIQQNPYIGDLNPQHIFIQTSVPAGQSALINQYYRPFLEIINRVVFRFIGPNPHGFHFFNILLHIANSFLVYCVVSRLVQKSMGLSLAAAVLFLVHPAQSEAVACISGISNLVFAFLCLSSFHLYLRAVHGKNGPIDRRGYGLSLFIFFLALLSKEQSVVLPFLLIAYEFSFASQGVKAAVKKYWFPIGNYFAVTAAYFMIRKMLFGFALTPVPGNQGELALRLLAIPRSLLTYLKIIFLPNDLHYYRSQDILLPFWGPMILFMCVLAVVVFLMIKIPRPHKRWMIFGLSWFAISLGPTLNIIPLVNEYSLLLTSDHFLYLPIIGIFLWALSAGHYWMSRPDSRKRKGVACAVLAGVVIIFAGMTMKQNTYWRAEIPLFEHTLKYQPNFGRVHFLLAKAYARAGRIHEAIEEDAKALAIMRGYAQRVENTEIEKFYLRFIKDIHYHLGVCYDGVGRTAQSLEHFQESLSLAPKDTTVNFSVGLAYLKLDNIQQAAKFFERAFTLDKNNLMAANSLAILYQKMGKEQEAETLLRMIAEKDAESVSARQNLAEFLRKKK